MTDLCEVLPGALASTAGATIMGLMGPCFGVQYSAGQLAGPMQSQDGVTLPRPYLARKAAWKDPWEWIRDPLLATIGSLTCL